MSGAEFLCYLQLLAELQPEERMLDIGCGCGLMALHLKNYLNSKATYTGIDIHAPSVKWSQNNISKKYPNFAFAHIDARNQVFNPRSEHPSETYSLPFDDESFDVILLKSVFTHMRPSEIDNYIGEVARLLSHRGRCLMTFFLLNEQQAELATQRLDTLDFAFGDGAWRYVYRARGAMYIATAPRAPLPTQRSTYWNFYESTDCISSARLCMADGQVAMTGFPTKICS